MLEYYKSTLEWSLEHRLAVLGISFLILVSSFVIFGLFNQGVEFFPEDIPPNRVYVQIETPAGTNVEFTRDIAEELESRLTQLDNYEDVETIVNTPASTEWNGGN